MKSFFLLLTVITTVFSLEKNVVLFTGLEDGEMAEYQKTFNSDLRKVWGADHDITLVSETVISKLKYKSPTGSVEPDERTLQYLQRHGIDSVIMVVPHLQKYEIGERRQFGIRGAAATEIYGELTIRYSFLNLGKGEELFTIVIETDTTTPSTVTLLRPVKKASTVSAVERDEMSTLLIKSNIRQVYQHFRKYLQESLSSGENNGSSTADSAVN